MMSGYDKTRTYFHRFKIMKQENCPCKNLDQAIDHLIYRLTLLHTSRELLRFTVLKTGNWPANKQELTTADLKAFLTYTNSTDFEQL